MKEEKSIQLDCQKKVKEELKILWALTVLSDVHLLDQPSFKNRALRSLRSPFCYSDPILEILSYLLAKKLGRNTPPFIPKYSCLPLFELCQLAMLWSIAGFSQEASALAHSISPLLDFPFLWCREEEYVEKESEISIFLFRSRAFLAEKKLPPFFLAIHKLFSTFDVPCSVDVFSPQLLLFHSSDARGALSLSGRGTSLGIFLSKEIEVRAFGPQGLPLNELGKFGIERALGGLDGWTNLSALPEVWLEVKKFSESGLDVRFFGLTPESSLNFSFYIKASEAQIGVSYFQPKSLVRYLGESKAVVFGGKFKIESMVPSKMELIPLAGQNSFWGTDFLLSFEIHPFESRGLFKWGLF